MYLNQTPVGQQSNLIQSHLRGLRENAHKYLRLLTSSIISTFSSLFPQVAESMLRKQQKPGASVCSFHSSIKRSHRQKTLHPNKVIKPERERESEQSAQWLLRRLDLYLSTQVTEKYTLVFFFLQITRRDYVDDTQAWSWSTSTQMGRLLAR